MDFIALGKTNILVSRTAFGAMSLDCKEIEAFGDEAEEKACAIVHQAYVGGINFFDTSHSKIKCEKRLGYALHGIRQNVFLATKSQSQSVHELRNDLQESLSNLDTDYIDLFQLENPEILPSDKTMDGLYNELKTMQQQGVIRHFGIATENLELAKLTSESGLYETVQFPFSMISPEQAVEVVKSCEKNDVGCIAMQPLNGGVISNIPLALGYLHQFENIVPVWGIHTQDELKEILYFTDKPPVIDEAFNKEVEKIRMFFN